mgnify:CR=1 FL=1
MVFTTSTSDSEFLFFRLGFDSINLARQSQELKINPTVTGGKKKTKQLQHAVWMVNDDLINWEAS